jgi:C-terminal processing protease CtpA/Prc
VEAAARPAANRAAIERLHAFARLYGYVRWFHPSDEAAATDWTRFAILGARRARHAAGRDALLRTLDSLFLPIAPTVQIYRAGQPPAARRLAPPDTAGLEVVAWQHRGVGLGAVYSTYRSVRLNRGGGEAAAADFGTVTRRVPAGNFRGRKILLRAAARAEVEGEGDQVQLWLRVDRPDRQRGFFDNMDDRPIRRSGWGTYEIIGSVAEDATEIWFGGFLRGEGQGYLDDFELLVETEEGVWLPVPLENAGFEQGVTTGWFASSPNYLYRTERDPDRPGSCLSITRSQAPGNALFEDHPRVGEVVEKPLGAGLAARVPLALYADATGTLGAGDSATSPPHDGRGAIDLAKLDPAHPYVRQAAAHARLREALSAIDTLDAADPDVRLAAVIVAWNVFQHFYPYFDVVTVDWERALDEALAAAVAADRDGFQRVLEHLVARLDDGHGRVEPPGGEDRARLPFVAHRIEGHPVIVGLVDSRHFALGDVVLAIDGVPAEELLRDLESRRSGSVRWKQYRATVDLGRGPRGSTGRVDLLRGGKRVTVEATRDTFPRLREPRPLPIEEIRPGIVYVDLDRASLDGLEGRMPQLAEARAVVFDLRGYPNGNHEVLRHLTDRPLRSARWMVPLAIYPDRERIAGWDTSGVWSLEPAQPRVTGKVLFLTDARAISYAESFLGIVEAYRLGEIVGQATAGANGNVNPMSLPGGYRVMWTGMRVLKHDGSRHHLVGIQPTVPVERTLRGVREGRDEVLEKAVELALH